MRAVLDTNILVSATLSPLGPSARVVDAWRARLFDVVTRPDLIDEVGQVMARDSIRARHRWTQEQIEFFLAVLAEQAIVTPGDLQVKAIAEDPDDDMVLACAVEGQADYIVSGDQHLLGLGAFQRIPIVTPAQFLRILAGEASPSYSP